MKVICEIGLTDSFFSWQTEALTNSVHELVSDYFGTWSPYMFDSKAHDFIYKLDYNLMPVIMIVNLYSIACI